MDARLVGGKLLRRGYTTGSCAAAAAKAASAMLLMQTVCRTVTLTVPGGIVLTLDVLNSEVTPSYASCAIQKDGGDDPDVKNGGILVGTSAPVILTSRADSIETKMNSIALAALVAENK